MELLANVSIGLLGVPGNWRGGNRRTMGMRGCISSQFGGRRVWGMGNKQGRPGWAARALAKGRAGWFGGVQLGGGGFVLLLQGVHHR